MNTSSKVSLYSHAILKPFFLCILVTHLVIFFVLELHSLFLLPLETEVGIFKQILNGDLDFVSKPWPSISENSKEVVKKMLDRP